jgi:hypothetical protein
MAIMPYRTGTVNFNTLPVDFVAISDQGVDHTPQIEQAIPVDVVARQPGDLPQSCGPIRSRKGQGVYCHELGPAMRFSINFIFALASCVLALGQIAQPTQETTTIHVLTDLIEVPVLAFKLPFRPEPGLSKSQFVIQLDGGTPFHPSHVRIQGAEPLNLIVLVEAGTQDAHLLSQSLQNPVWKAGRPPFSMIRIACLSTSTVADSFGR